MTDNTAEIDPALLAIIVCPSCRAQVRAGGRASWSARAVGWPTPSATASRCCSSTRHASRADAMPVWFDESRLDDACRPRSG